MRQRHNAFATSSSIEKKNHTNLANTGINPQKGQTQKSESQEAKQDHTLEIKQEACTVSLGRDRYVRLEILHSDLNE